MVILLIIDNGYRSCELCYIYYIHNIYIIMYVSKLREIHPPLQQK